MKEITWAAGMAVILHWEQQWIKTMNQVYLHHGVLPQKWKYESIVYTVKYVIVSSLIKRHLVLSILGNSVKVALVLNRIAIFFKKLPHAEGK